MKSRMCGAGRLAAGRRILAGLVLGLVLGLGLGVASGFVQAPQGLIQSVHAAEEGSFRVYRLNSKDQLIRNRWSRKRAEAGCHDLRGTKKAYRVAQVGFAWCTIYAGDKCEAGTELGAKWRGGKYRRAEFDPEEPQQKILPGANWYLSEGENVQVGSWRCEH